MKIQIFAFFAALILCFSFPAKGLEANLENIPSAFAELDFTYGSLTTILKEKKLNALLKDVDESQKNWNGYFSSQKKLIEEFSKGRSPEIIKQQRKMLLTIIQERVESLITILIEVRGPLEQ